VGGTLPLLGKLEGRLPRRSGLVITWGGLRGGIAMVLALAIPKAWPFRDLAIDIVFGTCLLTILVQGTTMARLLRWLGLSRDRSEQEKLQEIRGRLRALQAALRFLDRQREAGTVDPEMYEQVHDEMVQEMKALEIVRAQTRDIEDLMRREELSELRRQLLQVRKAALRQARVDGHVSETISRRLIGEIDEILHEMGKDEGKEHES
jgi:CPA1 family monovalent cation:H+ antiporter